MFSFSRDEVYEINRAQLILLGVAPSEVDGMSVADMALVLKLAAGNRQIEAHYMKRAMRP